MLFNRHRHLKSKVDVKILVSNAMECDNIREKMIVAHWRIADAPSARVFGHLACRSGVSFVHCLTAHGWLRPPATGAPHRGGEMGRWPPTPTNRRVRTTLQSYVGTAPPTSVFYSNRAHFTLDRHCSIDYGQLEITLHSTISSLDPFFLHFALASKQNPISLSFKAFSAVIFAFWSPAFHFL